MSEAEEAVLVCAIRYALGRQSYMPNIVIEYAKSKLKDMSANTLRVVEKDIDEASKRPRGLGDEEIDAPAWISFKCDVIAETISRNAREKERC